MVDWIETLTKVSQAGSTLLLLIALYGGIKGWWIPRWLYDRQCQETAIWRRLALRGTRMAEEAVEERLDPGTSRSEALP